ncbi:MAG: hypothetical protein QOI16_1087, partial [Pseudonocardiales bacterium]|nr:hypothetical protein [Pseudonocardiales bacterium]
MSVPEIDLTDVAVLRDLPTVYARAREQAPVARLLIPGFPMWAVLRHDAARTMLADSRFALSSNSYQHLAVPDDSKPYLRSLQEMEGAEHARLRRLVSPAFTPRRAAQLSPRIARIVGSLLDGLAAENAPVDLVPGLARPLPIKVICEVVGIPEGERARWHTYGAAVAAGRGDAFAEAVPAIVGDAKAAVARRREEPADDLLSDLVRARTDDGDQLDDVEIVALVWLLVLAGQTPANLIANAVAALLTHPAQLAMLRADPELLPGAVDELMRWCGPQLLTVPRFAAADAAIAG